MPKNNILNRNVQTKLKSCFKNTKVGKTSNKNVRFAKKPSFSFIPKRNSYSKNDKSHLTNVSRFIFNNYHNFAQISFNTLINVFAQKLCRDVIRIYSREM